MKKIEFRFDPRLSFEFELLDIEERSLMFWSEPREEMIFKRENRTQYKILNKLEREEAQKVS